MSSDNEQQALIAERKFDERVRLGKEGEQRIVDQLRAFGIEIEDVSEEVDMLEKIDRVIIENGKRYSCQVKFREGLEKYRDILLDLFEPFYGQHDSRTKIGRDYVSQYERFVCQIKNKIYLIDGTRQKAIIEYALNFWRKDGCPSFWYSRKPEYKGLEIRLSRDHKNHRPKLLMFIPPAVYVGNEVQVFELPE